MKIHEYQGKAILSKYGVAVPRGHMVESREAADTAAKALFHDGATGVVVKAQIHAGGRGKGGGVKIAKSPEEAGALAAKMLGMNLVTHQTGPEGKRSEEHTSELQSLPTRSSSDLSRQRRRRQDRQVAGRGRRTGGQDARNEPGHAPDWSRGQEIGRAHV